ncbi:hypothetical protein [Legionella sp.]|uniref:hypothetical protein n=1 Tax=Legionella sp. TaxID=459 RepID=UPI00321F88DE
MPLIKRLMVKLATKALNAKIAQFKTALPTHLFHADVDLLQAHYRLNRSHFSRFADWYAKHPWWQKMLWGIIFIGGIGLSTVALYLLAAISVATLVGVIALTTAFYLSATALLTNHKAMEVKRFEAMTTEVKRIEAELQATIQSFQLIEERLASLLVELNEQHSLLDEYAEVLEGQISQLNQELSAAKAVIAKLNEVVDTLQNDTANQKKIEQALTAQLQTLQEAILTDTAQVVEIAHQLNGNTSALSETETLLKSINQTLTVCDSAFKAKLDTLAEQIKTTEAGADQLTKLMKQCKTRLTTAKPFVSKCVTRCNKVEPMI